MPNDPIKQALDAYFAQNAVAPTRADALRVAARHVATAPQPQPTVSAVAPASPLVTGKPLGGPIGALFDAGRHVDTFLHQSMKEHAQAIKAAAPAALATAALSAALPELGAARALAPMAEAAAPEADVTAQFLSALGRGGAVQVPPAFERRAVTSLLNVLPTSSTGAPLP
jgi:hypothetical protein